ncbi:hypothetical protein FOA52_015753 [Chlamydomonas sp. UWO 241]|nr:hypothetical protein FOA52_015753 [Chlamydomonas sp. UWO 241]
MLGQCSAISTTFIGREPGARPSTGPSLPLAVLRAPSDARRPGHLSRRHTARRVAIMAPKAPKVNAITVVPNFGGKRCIGEPPGVVDWGTWDCDPTKTGPPDDEHSYGPTFPWEFDMEEKGSRAVHGVRACGTSYGPKFPWEFDMEEKAYIIEGTATLTADDPAKHGGPVNIGPKDMVTFPKGWAGSWLVHSFIKKRYAFFDAKGFRVDEDDDDVDEEEEPAPKAAAGKRGAKATKKGRPEDGESEPEEESESEEEEPNSEDEKPKKKAKKAPARKPAARK